MNDFRIGHGYDVHALADGLPLRLGGVLIEHPRGCVAHSDGDALIHALCDALLGAAAMGDIGLHFPDTSERFKGIDSRILLRHTVEMLRDKGYRIGNVDCTLCLQRPKIKPYIAAMRETLAETMGIDPERVSVKATTTERQRPCPADKVPPGNGVRHTVANWNSGRLPRSRRPGDGTETPGSARKPTRSRPDKEKERTRLARYGNPAPDGIVSPGFRKRNPLAGLHRKTSGRETKVR